MILTFDMPELPGPAFPKYRPPVAKFAFLLCLLCVANLHAANSVRTLTYGMSNVGEPLTVTLVDDFLDLNSKRKRVLIVPRQGCSSELRAAIKRDLTQCVDGVGSEDRVAAAVVDRFPNGPEEFPPTEPAYSGSNAELHYLWRSIGVWAPDLVIVISDGTRPQFGPHRLANSLTSALNRKSVAGMGTVAATELQTTATDGWLKPLRDADQTGWKFLKGTAPAEVRRRLARTPIDVARQLSDHYGQAMKGVSYIPALALISRLRLGEMTDDPSQRQLVLKIVAPFANREKSSLGSRVSGSALAGHLVFAELADPTMPNDPFTTLVRGAADLGFDEQGLMLEAMPMHHEMSDAVFMATPILVHAARLTGESKYLDMAFRHAKYMLRLNLRDDGLHQHSPLDPEGTAWGRGNGFPALGLAISLSQWSGPKAGRYQELLAAYQSHIAAMIRHQDPTGMWHQVVDRPESYCELTVTCMTTFAIARGIRKGWLDRKKHERVVRRGWAAIKPRIGRDGSLIDVCTGTGKQKNLRDYFHRKAILGSDDRGGAMAMLVAMELAAATSEAKISLATERFGK